jgi:hypothetical protein
MDVNIVLAGLRSRGEHAKRMQNLCPDQYDFYEKEYEAVARVYDIIQDAQDRAFRSDNLTARISIKL